MLVMYKARGVSDVVQHSKMIISPVLSILTTMAFAQSSFTIVRPLEGEYLQLGGTFPVELHVSVCASPCT